MLTHVCEKVYLMVCFGCAQVSVIDEGLLKFSKLEELVLSANKITEIPAENLPSTLKVSNATASLRFLCSLTSKKPVKRNCLTNSD